MIWNTTPFDQAAEVAEHDDPEVTAGPEVTATVRVTLAIPASLAQQALKGTAWEHIPLGTEAAADREPVEDLLCVWVSENFAALRENYLDDSGTEVEW